MHKDGSHQWVNQVSKGTGFTVAGIGDFNGDGISDIFWRNGVANSLWLMHKDGSHQWVPQVDKAKSFQPYL